MMPFGRPGSPDGVLIEGIVKRKDGRKPAGHIARGRGIQASQIGGDNVHFEPLPLRDASDVATQRLVRWTIGQ